MNTSRIFLLLILVLIFVECKPEIGKVEDENQTENKVSEFKIPKNIDDNFKVFLSYFSKDSVFQVSRVKFPLKVMEVDENNMMESIEKTIEKEEYTKLDFEYPKDALTREFDRYTQKVKTNGNKVTVEIRGVDNGIYTDFYFEKVNGKWFLKSWNDTSN
ncbi:DUF4348 domain-containing protein [Flavobacterium sp. J49]|uniref:DUF4348 domain-containing protein n=1 Tax=Flavobacterium sp. J49 TaxID=2718534 RepID=UPI0015945EFF|nr:DUF4348 domain-containing protein [Flavobacterium sp. J49]MBF6640282.1 DUF4348 domain-containing protein [Flavobacterium sp. J49]NIC01527.1 DUF4348 domain-containing protein [Flavobacterium sp. J49]